MSRKINRISRNYYEEALNLRNKENEIKTDFISLLKEKSLEELILILDEYKIIFENFLIEKKELTNAINSDVEYQKSILDED